MKKFLIILLYIPLFAWSKCQEGGRKDFLRAHEPNNQCSASEEGLCIETPRKIDDKLYDDLISFDTNFLPAVDEATIEKWEGNKQEENKKISNVPPDTFLIVDNALRMDLTRRSVFVSCNGKEFYLRDNGGLMDKWSWYGPVAIDNLTSSPR